MPGVPLEVRRQKPRVFGGEGTGERTSWFGRQTAHEGPSKAKKGVRGGKKQKGKNRNSAKKP